MEGGLTAAGGGRAAPAVVDGSNADATEVEGADERISAALDHLAV